MVVGREGLLEGIRLKIEIAPLWLLGWALLGSGIVVLLGVVVARRRRGGILAERDDVVGRNVVLRAGWMSWRGHDVRLLEEAVRERMTTRAELRVP